MSRRKVQAGVEDLTTVRGDDLVWLQERYELWNEGGIDAMVRHVWHSNITFYDPPDFPDATMKRGAAAVAAHVGARLDAVPGATFRLERAWWVRAEEILAELLLHIGGQASGVKLDVPLFHTIRVDEERRVVELREYTQLEHALEAVGLRE